MYPKKYYIKDNVYFQKVSQMNNFLKVFAKHIYLLHTCNNLTIRYYVFAQVDTFHKIYS